MIKQSLLQVLNWYTGHVSDAALSVTETYLMPALDIEDINEGYLRIMDLQACGVGYEEEKNESQPL
jgi:hypothetical protein